jgi:hypothetical protein
MNKELNNNNNNKKKQQKMLKQLEGVHHIAQ